MNLEKTLEYYSKCNPLLALEDALTLYNAIMTTPEGDVVEIGSASGGSTAVLIGAAEEVNKKVYSVDPYPEELEGKAAFYYPGLMKTLKDNFKRNILDGPFTNVVQYNVETAKCLDKLPYKISVAFIDSCHELFCVQNEINLLGPRIVPGGYMFIHDSEWAIGQISNTLESGLTHIEDWLKTTPYTNTGRIKTMLYWKNE